MMAQQYWNEIGSQKVFEDPLYLDKLSPFLSPTAVEELKKNAKKVILRHFPWAKEEFFKRGGLYHEQ